MMWAPVANGLPVRFVIRGPQRDGSVPHTATWTCD